MNAFCIIHRWYSIKSMTPAQKTQVVPRVIIIGGKSAPGYANAKLIIKLMNRIAVVINNDAEVGDLLKLVFLPNYCVSVAEILIPASDISQHISTAGMEASGTSNMKFALNGGLLLGTMDGANIEIREEIGHENIFIFGTLAADVNARRASPPRVVDPRLLTVFSLIRSGVFGCAGEFQKLIDSVEGTKDYYIVCHDFPLYLKAQEEVDEAFKDPMRWARMSLLSTARMGKFSSDRSIQEYAEQIWHIEPCKLEAPARISLGTMSSTTFAEETTPPSGADCTAQQPQGGLMPYAPVLTGNVTPPTISPSSSPLAHITITPPTPSSTSGGLSGMFKPSGGN